MFFSETVFAKESFLDAKFVGLFFKRNPGFFNHLLHVGKVHVVVWALAILREMGGITAIDAKVRTARKVGIVVAFTIIWPPFPVFPFAPLHFLCRLLLFRHGFWSWSKIDRNSKKDSHTHTQNGVAKSLPKTRSVRNPNRCSKP